MVGDLKKFVELGELSFNVNLHWKQLSKTLI